MSKPLHFDLSRRERQIMDVIHRRGRATVGDIQEELEGEATYSAIRSALRLLRDKKVIRHEHDGKKYVYLATMPRDQAGESALKHLVETFFSGSQAATVSAILEMADTDLPDEELDRLEELISRARQQDSER
ncbi:MAG: BlaI/MecI/CopY family transcriptional regulator [Acidobacteria bacterium]|nr:BlaI/MecI/CopY family transcriptional regulator [Acidobacteriota bacterium]